MVRSVGRELGAESIGTHGQGQRARGSMEPGTGSRLQQPLQYNIKKIIVRVRVCVRAAALFCPWAEEPGRETGPAAMGHPSWGSSMGFV